MEESNRPAKPFPAYAIVGLTILAPALGGSTELWAEGSLAIATGLLVMIWPPKKSLGWVPSCLLVGLVAISLTGFLPANWLPLPQWRSQLLKLDVQLPSTHSPQPWLTFQWSCFLLLVLAWAYYLAGFQWSRRVREKACTIFALAILVLSAALTVAYITKLRVPFWPVVEEFGFFPNRNQTSNVLGLGGVMIYALGLQRFQEGRRYWWIWFASLSLLCWALILNFSRAGIILFFCGALAVHIYWWSTTKDRRQTLIAFGGLILLIALFVIDGGATLMRFGKETAMFFSPAQNFRLSIYRDAIGLILKSSPLGVGLGNFWPIFAINRHYSANTSQAAHPESDWLWGAVDLGWVGLLLALALFCWWLMQCPPFEPGTNRLLRVAAMVCGIAFAIHGLFDVSGHRLGALWPALFFASIAIHPQHQYRQSTAVSILFRILGAVLVAVGLWWLASIDVKTLPTTLTVEQSRAQIDHAIEMENYDKVAALCSEALMISPLDWMFYFKRGVAEASLIEPRSKIVRDFAIARYLLPNWPDLYLKEGMVWLQVGQPDLAFGVWEEGMKRWPDNAPVLYSDVFKVIPNDAELRDRWRQLADTNVKCLLIFFQFASPAEFEIEINQLLLEDPELKSFTPAELKRVSRWWSERGDKLAFVETLQRHPEWQKIAWPDLARAFADYQDYRQAYETVARFSPAPRLPEINSREANKSLAARFRIGGGTEQEGLMLARMEAEGGDIDDALAILNILSTKPKPSRLVYYLQSQLWARKGEWQKAWQALSQFIND